jgi:hypothetical protein
MSHLLYDNNHRNHQQEDGTGCILMSLDNEKEMDLNMIDQCQLLNSVEQDHEEKMSKTCTDHLSRVKQAMFSI